jgi:hypothetical protein
MNRELNEADRKKSYEPPQLTTISLRPEEAVLGHCKTGNGGGNQPFGCAFAACSSIGS